MLPKEFDLDQYKSILLRRRGYIITTFVVVVMAGVIYALTAPRMYKASTLILVQRQKVPENYIKPTVTDTLPDRINTIRQQVTSRTNLENLIAKFSLYTGDDPAKGQMLMEEKVEVMRRRIEIIVARTAAFSISFTDRDPYKSKDVANALASNFMDEHLRGREEQSFGTTAFLEFELNRIEQILREKENSLTAFKQSHMGGLPSQLQTNITLIGQIGKKIESLERSIDEARSQRIMLQGQVGNMKQMMGPEPMDQLVELAPGDAMATTPEVHELKDRLESLLLRYTENHPDVIKLKEMIARIEEKQGQEIPATGDQAAPDYDNLLGGDNFLDAQVGALQMQLASIDLTLKDLLTQKAKLEKESNRLDKIIADTPKIQLQQISLERDYDTIKRQYDSLLAKKLDSQLASNMEKTQKGEQFKIIDPAKLPEKPFSPNRAMIMLVAVLAGLAAGVGLALGVEYLDHSFRDYEELGEFLQLPVLAVIPRIKTTEDMRKQKLFKIFAYCLSGCLLLFLGIGVWLWVNGNLQEWVEKIRTLV